MMTVVFKTDDSRNATGFKARWESIGLDGIEGEFLRAPNYPNTILSLPYHWENLEQVMLLLQKSILFHHSLDVDTCSSRRTKNQNNFSTF